MLFWFHQSYPNVRLSFMRNNVSELYDALHREDIDVCINLGYALPPGYLTQAFPAGGKVVAIPIEVKSAEITIAAAWLPQCKNDLLDAFLDEFLITND